MPVASIQWNRDRCGRGALALVMAILLALCTGTAAPPVNPANPANPAPPANPATPSKQAEHTSPKAALQKAVAALIREAKLARSAGQLTRQTANFAEQFEHELDGELLAKKLLRPADRDPFIDAYVRWQLTSFKPALPALTDRQFDDFLAALPGYTPNPRAQESLVNQLLALRQTNPLPSDAHAGLHDVLEDMARKTAVCTVLNQPVTQLRDWVESAAGDANGRTLQAMLSRCAAMIAGGWDVRDLKAKLDDRFSAAARDANLNGEDRQRLTQQAQRLAGQRRLWITSAVIVENSLQVDTAETAVYDFDVTRWTRPLLDH